MKAAVLLLAGVLFSVPGIASAQFAYTTNADGVTLTIIGFAEIPQGSGPVNIPAMINGLAVVNIANSAFGAQTIGPPPGGTAIGVVPDFYPTSAIIPNTVTNIGADAFFFCASMTNIVIGNSVASIGDSAFLNCLNLNNVTIPASVTNIQRDAFANCAALTNLLFVGNAPAMAPNVFQGGTSYFYYLPGTSGWDSAEGGALAVLWQPQISSKTQPVGIQSNHFGFWISGPADIPIVVAASADLASGVWSPLQSFTLTNGSIYFSDPSPADRSRLFYTIMFP